jgi:NhaP-type Na+/H+ or K+/H+ antiporter
MSAHLRFCTIFDTLIVQGRTLGPLIRALGIKVDADPEREITGARARIAEALTMPQHGISEQSPVYFRRERSSLISFLSDSSATARSDRVAA